MRWMARLRLRARSLFRRNRVERELDEELLFHVDRLTEQYLAAGFSPDYARAAALREMGGVDHQKEACRDARGLAFVDSLRQDFGYALRALRKTPAFTAVALLSLAIGIGANTTIFTFVNAVLLRPLPYPDAHRLVIVRERALAAEGTVNVHPANFLAWQARARAFESIALLQTPPMNVVGRDGAEQVSRIQTTADLFRVLGVSPVLGRAFTADEARLGGREVVILGHGFWQRWFGGDPNILGRELAVPDGSLTIVGVAPPGLRLGTFEPDAYTLLRIDPAHPASVGSRSFQCYARLKPASTVEDARAELGAIAADLAQQPLNAGMGVFVSGLQDYLVTGSRSALRLLMGVVVTVLVIACVNLAGLLMARSLARRGELAVRAALGASRGRLVRQLALESLLLSLLGGAAGLLVATLATRLLIVVTAGTLTAGITTPPALDLACVLFTLGVSVVTGLVFGLIPAWQASRAEPQTALRERTRSGTADRRHHHMRRLLVVAEIALAVVLLVGAGLLLRTFSGLVGVRLGFQPANAITMNLFLGVRSPEQRAAQVERILERVQALPGVVGAGTVQFLPLAGTTCGTSVWIDAQAATDPSQSVPTDCSLISRGYFAAMGIPLLEGRDFDRRDTIASPRVLLVNRAFARRYFPDGIALGRRIFVQGSNQASAEIVGVGGDIRHTGLTSEPSPTVFLSHAQTPGYITNLAVRTSGDAVARIPDIRGAIRDVDPMQAVSSVKTLDAHVGDALAKPKLYAVLVTSFALIAVLLAAIGVYGLIAYIVAQRAQEIGIRLALGASRARIFLDQCRQAGALVVLGLAIGVAASAGLRSVMSSFLFGVTAGDPVAYAAAAGALALAAAAAVVVPARRASRVDPLTALGSD